MLGGAGRMSHSARGPIDGIKKMVKPHVTDTTQNKDGFADELAPGTTLLHGQYTIDSFLNAGGFGITYLARDSLDRKVVIKECFPGSFCRRSRAFVQPRSRAHQNELRSIVRLFVQEAHNLAKLNHPNIVGVHQVFEDNDTAYMALDYVDGHDLLDVIEDASRSLTPAQIKTILTALLDAVACIHGLGILHRDISPDNILISADLHPVLIDFGAAREQASKQSRVLSAMRVVKDGYSPQEFYIAGSEQGPSSDLYALAASFYHLISGEVPPNSQARLAALASGERDPYQKLAGRIAGYDAGFLAAIDRALAILPKDRLQSAQDWLAMIQGQKVAAQPAATTTSPAKAKAPVMLIAAGVGALALLGAGVMLIGNNSAPLPVVTTPAVQLPADFAMAAAQPLAAPTTALGPAVIALPDAPDAGAATSLPAPPAVVQAIAPAADAPSDGIVSEWLVDLPFAAQDAGSNIITDVVPDAPRWLRAGLAITAVNGTPITDIAQIMSVLYAGLGAASDNASLTAQIDTLDPVSGKTDSHDLTVPVLRRLSLGNGTTFESRYTDDAWRSVVVAVPAGDTGGLRVGDVLDSYIPTGQAITAADTLHQIFHSGPAAGADTFTFAVQRDGSKWVASITAPAP